MFELTQNQIDGNKRAQGLSESKAGALVTFEGWVRNHNQGKAVSSLEYQVYEALALSEGQKVLEEAKEKFNLHQISCVHRHGHLKIGEIAVWVGASASHRDDAFLATRYVIDEIKFRLPIWKKEHYLNEAPVWVYCKDHTTHVHFEENELYAKQKSVVNQSVLKSKKVLVVGAGGLGCPVLTALTSSGIGEITVVDFDQIEISNLHRQPLFSFADVGESKAMIAQKVLREKNPFINIKAVTVRLGAENTPEVIQGQDLILDCTDNLETKFRLHDICHRLGIPLVSASIFRYEAQLRTFDSKKANACLRCQLPTTPSDEITGNCNGFGVLGAAVSTIGSLQANEAIQYLSRGTNSSSDETVYIDLLSLSFLKIKNRKRDDCETCKGSMNIPLPLSPINPLEIEAKDLMPDFELVDIRNEDDSFLDRFTDSSKKIIVYCHKGIRSKRLVSQYRARGFQHFYSLMGGACSL